MTTVHVEFHRPLYLRPKEKVPQDLAKSFDSISHAMHYARRMAGLYARHARVRLKFN